MTITVLPEGISSNDPPTAQDGTASASYNTPVQIPLKATDKDRNDEQSASIIDGPSNGHLSDIDQNTGIVTYTSNLVEGGDDNFTFKVNDGHDDSNVTKVTISVTPAQGRVADLVPLNHPPTAQDGTASASYNTPVQIPLKATDKDRNDEQSASIIDGPSNGHLSDIDQNTGIVTYTSNLVEGGDDDFTFKVNDGHDDSNVAKVTISVTPAQGTVAESCSTQPSSNSSRWHCFYHIGYSCYHKT